MAAVVCHPHPQYGGTMHNKVVYRAARALQNLDMAVLRFNFRGVGLSEGTYDEGRGEQDDARAAIDYLNERYPKAKIVLAGFSFGASVGLRAGCRDNRVSYLIGIGTPVGMSDLAFLKECRKPKLFIQGSEDQFGSAEQLRSIVSTLPEPKEIHIIQGAGHFFDNELDELMRVIENYFKGQG